MKCACCGSEMLPDKELEKTIIYKCKECGLSDSRLTNYYYLAGTSNGFVTLIAIAG
jgi:hypothetical protein